MSAAPSPSAGATQPRRSALKADTDSERTPPLSASVKAVQIAAPEPSSSADEAQTRKQFPATIARRLSGRPAIQTSSSRTSLFSLGSVDGGTGDSGAGASSSNLTEEVQQSQHRHRIDRMSERLLAQVADWLEREKTKKETKKTHRLTTRRKSPPVEKAAPAPAAEPSRARAPSVDSNSSEVSLDRLQRILDDSMAVLGLTSVPHLGPHLGRKHHKKSHKRLPSLSRTVSSDTEFFDGDVVVPSCDAVLDNSKTLSYVGGKAAADDAASISSRREEKEKQAWIIFKNEIIRLAHTLTLKGWRRVPLDSGETISVERLSGALTNAVYVVSPPPESVLPPAEGKKQPTKVLLRIYGPQVEHLIDRETELSVLRRLARKKIGPRLLGTFLNGRFEQFFNAATLTPANLREPETSKQIAKRMRELHDGVELLEEERLQGPAVWKNWDKWLNQAERTVQYLDKQILSGNPGVPRGPGSAWKGRGLVCGVEWPVFKAMVEKYRKFLDDHYGNPKKIRQKLVFAHNDTQYGNILRIRPDDEKSPLLVPANEHKQLVVIDFEYAAANLPGYELANHFSEWTYNYHDHIVPYACDTSKYPTVEQQHRFIRAYVDHKSKFSTSGASTPKMTPTETGPATPALHSARSASSIVEFTLDARAPPGGWKEQESKNEDATEKRIKELMDETRLWRIANSAQWVSWGIIQAKIPGLVLSPEDGAAPAAPAAPAEEDGVDPDIDPDAFDYLGYSQDRVLFFWGDCVLMGLVELEELPEEVREKVKLVHY
ncbi:kinase-like domain-containing protein [Lasiosphaeria hispida]|uniref:Kinase-like domain-containing protein n=1 Tax=Lasiosphaeria hispida TaxID=260671 RepID=A0AAJ0MK25_9PEZI|nr:kinase-like domain-containing protein [Lasiosphaeria hispida]